jgi:hypothetical protein
VAHTYNPRFNPGQKVFKIPIPMKNVGVVAHTCLPSYGGKPKNRRIKVQLAWAKKQDPISKITRGKRTGGVAQVVEHLLSNHKAIITIILDHSPKSTESFTYFICYSSLTMGNIPFIG